MTDHATDDKIARLVHSVLEAVDLRLAEVRHEILVLGEEAGLRHLEVQQQIQDLSRRIDRASFDPPAANGAEPRTVASEAVTEVLLEQLEATHRRHVEMTEQRLARLDAAIAELRSAPAPAPVLPPAAAASGPLHSLTPSLPAFAQVSAPLLDGHTTGAPPSRREVTGEHQVIQEGEQIDLDRLTDLLTERLGQLDLPHAPHRSTQSSGA